MAFKANWTKACQDEVLKRSSLCVSAISGSAYVFGGELEPRQPRDNEVHVVSLPEAKQNGKVQTLTIGDNKPPPRVGAAMAAIGNNIYMFSGRGGEAMAPIAEQGKLWVLNTEAQNWTLLTPSSTTYPEARSYHSMTSNGCDTIFVHAGCPEKGRLSDLWSFNLKDRTWKALESAPDPPRGGPSVEYVDGKIYRMNGFDGTHEQGGAIDVFDLASSSWSSIKFSADGKAGPSARSVAALVAVTVRGEKHLVTMFGESDPSNLGHQGAGKMLSDVWAFCIAKRTWQQVATSPADAVQGRGWFDACKTEVGGRDCILVAGGLGESNERLDDVWVLVPE